MNRPKILWIVGNIATSAVTSFAVCKLYLRSLPQIQGTQPPSIESSEANLAQAELLPGSESDQDPLTETEIEKLLGKMRWHPEDPLKPNEFEAYTDSELSDFSEDAAQAILEQLSDYVLANESKKAPDLFAIGRFALLQGYQQKAQEWLFKSSNLGFPAATAYLADPALSPLAEQQWSNLTKACQDGFTPALDWKAQMRESVVKEVQRFAADPNDPSLAAEVGGVSDERIISYDAKEVDSLMEDYLFLTKERDCPIEVIFGLGRITFLQQRYDEAEPLLTLAAERDSAAALAYLAHEDITTNLDKRIEYLEKASKLGYKPAERRLAAAKELKSKFPKAREE